MEIIEDPKVKWTYWFKQNKLQLLQHLKTHQQMAFSTGSENVKYRDHTCCFFFHFRESCLNKRPSGREFTHRPRDQASVNAMKQTCVIVILAYFT